MIKKSTKVKIGIKGKVIATICDVSTPKAKRMEKGIIRLKAKNKHYKYEACFMKNQIKIRDLIQEFHRLFTVRRYATANLVTTIGRKSIARRLANDTTDTLIIDKGALGNDSTPATNGDTALGNQVYQNDIASRYFADNIASLTFFYTAGETDGTYEEFGMKIDNTILFNHNVEQWTKSGSESMTIDVIITVS